ncbi:phosphotransferase [Streptomyces acidiscabies]|uniref:phosphotransferase n=1 Tax=Streptomyces acidiscabies TaxID=42234 RepID=UPI0038F6211D
MTFTKHYPTTAQAAAAVRHHQWLATHAGPLRQPELTAIAPQSLTFARIEGRHATPDDLPVLAGLLGDAHGAAWSDRLYQTSMITPDHHFADGTPFGAYLAPRQAALRERRRCGFLPSDTALTSMLTILEESAEGRAAFYKDSNLRNFLITDDGAVFAVDPDQLTLAPFGYDLAKLVLSMILTYGPQPAHITDEALAAYNAAAHRHHLALGTTSRARFDDFMALHAVLTAPYLGRNGYRLPREPS